MPKDSNIPRYKVIEKDILDKIIPNLLAFGLTLLLYKSLQKGRNAIVLMVLIIVLSI